MKLKELLNNLYENDCFHETIIDNKGLSLIKDKLLLLDEFKNVKEFEIITTPILNDVKCSTVKLVDGFIFNEKVYLYSIAALKHYPLDTLHKPVKDGACISPIDYNAITFEPTRSITIRYTPVYGFNVDPEKIKEDLITKFKNVLDNPEEYEAKGEVAFLLRGIFQ